MTRRLPEPGDVFEQRYRIEAVLGEGGFGRVYRATNIETSRRVAIKMLKPSDRGDDLTRARRFLREVRAVAGLEHPNTITLFDYGRTDDGLLFMVSEYIDGQDLTQLCAERGTLSEPECVRVVTRVLESLREAHAAGLVHRDIKPDNIRVFEYAGDPLHVKVLDFGIAKSFTEEQAKLTGTGRVIGTVRYMSPDQLVGLELTPASDVYSVGLVAYEMLFGRDARGASDVAEGHFVRVTPTEVVSPAFAAILNRMLEPRVDDRYADAGEVLVDLRRMLKGGRLPRPSAPAAPAAPRPSTPAGPATPRRAEPAVAERQSPRAASVAGRWIWFAAGLAALIVVAGAALVLLTVSPEAPPPPPRSAQGEAEQRARALLADRTTNDTGPDRRRFDASTGCGEAHDPGRQTVTARLPLKEHRWFVNVPTAYEPEQPHPLLVVLPGTSSPAFMNELSTFRDQKPYVVAEVPIEMQPSLLRGGIDEEAVRRIRALAKYMQSRWCIDPSRIFVLGVSGLGNPYDGADFAQQLRCDPWVRGLAVVARYSRVYPRGSTCPERAVPILHLGPPMPDDGWQECETRGLFPMDCYPHDDAFFAPAEERWWRRNRCEGEPRIVTDHDRWRCWSGDCAVDSRICRVQGKSFIAKTGENTYSHTFVLIDQFFQNVSGTPGTDAGSVD